MAGSITMQSTLVNGGTAVDLPSSTVNFAWKSLTNASPVSGKYDIIEVDVGGFENPVISITGTMDAGSMPTNSLTQALLTDFAQIKFDGTTATVIKLTIASGGDGSTNVYLKGCPAAGYSINGTYRDFLYVVIDSFSINFTTNVKDERRWDFNITCHETKLR